MWTLITHKKYWSTSEIAWQTRGAKTNPKIPDEPHGFLKDIDQDTRRSNKVAQN